MAMHEFIVQLKDRIVNNRLLCRMGAAGPKCKDAKPFQVAGIHYIHFIREHPGGLGEAIMSARDDLREAGFTPLSATATVYFDDEPVAGNDTSN